MQLIHEFLETVKQAAGSGTGVNLETRPTLAQEY